MKTFSTNVDKEVLTKTELRKEIKKESATGGVGPQGPKGDKGDTGVGTQGPAGVDGKLTEYQANATHIQWRYVGDTLWINLLALTAITGPQGNDGSAGVKGDKGNAFVYSDFTTQQLLDLTGPAGQDGATGQPGSNGRNPEYQKSATHIQWRLVGDIPWINLVALVDIKGDNGTKGDTGAAGSDASVTKVNVEAVLTGEITSHTHPGGEGGLTQQQIMRLI